MSESCSRWTRYLSVVQIKLGWSKSGSLLNHARKELSAILRSLNIIRARNLLIRSFCDRQLPAVPDRQDTDAEADSQPGYRYGHDRQMQ
jgi:hypothetical protein